MHCRVESKYTSSVRFLLLLQLLEGYFDPRRAHLHIPPTIVIQSASSSSKKPPRCGSVRTSSLASFAPAQPLVLRSALQPYFWPPRGSFSSQLTLQRPDSACTRHSQQQAVPSCSIYCRAGVIFLCYVLLARGCHTSGNCDVSVSHCWPCSRLNRRPVRCLQRVAVTGCSIYSRGGKSTLGKATPARTQGLWRVVKHR